MAKHISFLGIDKSGKTTLLKNLKHELSDFQFVSWSRGGIPEKYKFLYLLRENVPLDEFDQFDDSLRSSIYSTLLLARSHIIQKHLEDGFNVISDCSHYKHLIKEQIYMRGKRTIMELWKNLPNPDLIIFLKLDPGSAYLRSDGLLNSQEYLVDKTKKDFIQFQSILQDEMLRAIADLNHVIVDANCDEEKLKEKVKCIAQDFIGQINE